jgi:hypothetical protein
MGVQEGLPWRWILRWTFEQMQQEPGFRHIRLDDVTSRIFFSAEGSGGEERGYRLSIEHGWPKVEQLEGPSDAAP